MLIWGRLFGIMAKGDNMDYNNHRCPVCDKPFDNSSDIVVCPQCGAPHHRECYELEMKCHFQDRHKDGFDYKTEYEAQQTQQKAETLTCRICGAEIEKGGRFCSQCGTATEEYAAYDRHSQEQSCNDDAPYSKPDSEFPQGDGKGQVHFETFTFDPMGGLKAEDEIGEGVTVGECAKFVKNNTPFYSRLFHQIHTTGRGRFSFVGFIFSGGWMLYRKMYKLGAVFTAILALLIITQLYISTFYSDLMVQFNQLTSLSFWYNQAESTITPEAFIAGLDRDDIIVLVINYLASVGQLALRVLCGIFGNKWYRNHCINIITQIKAQADSKETADTQLQTKGGVNNALAMSLIFSYFLLSVLPYFF